MDCRSYLKIYPRKAESLRLLFLEAKWLRNARTTEPSSLERHPWRFFTEDAKENRRDL